MFAARKSKIWLILAGLMMGGACSAASDIPNLVGTWMVEAEGGHG